MKISKIIGYIFAVIALIFEWFFGIISFVSFIIQIILVAVAIFFLIWIFRRSIAKLWKETILRYILIIASTIWFFVSVMLLFVSYQHMYPWVVSDISLSHSGQRLVFVGMSHIATPAFYDQKKKTIQSLSASGYTILVEWVKPGTPENQVKFNQSIGFDFTPTLYARIADILSLQSQDNQYLYMGISTGALRSVDLSIDDIVNMMGTGTVSSSEPGALRDIEREIESASTLLTRPERRWISWVGRGLLNWSLRRSDDLSGLLSSSDQSQLFDTIIHDRNDTIISYIQAHPTENIAIVYGALHFNWIYESLQRLDPLWKIDSIDSSGPYIQ